MYSDGVVQEGDLLRAVNRLLFRQALARAGPAGPAGRRGVDVAGLLPRVAVRCCLRPAIAGAADRTGRRGVAVVASAGNDSTPRHMYPAGFYPNRGPVFARRARRRPGLQRRRVEPGRPDDRVVQQRRGLGQLPPGRASRSSAPCRPRSTLRCSRPPAPRSPRASGPRSTWTTIAGGFATWSGTSFAAPVLAGEIAQKLIDQDAGRSRPAQRSHSRLERGRPRFELDRPPQA